MKKYLILCVLGLVLFTGCQGSELEKNVDESNAGDQVSVENNSDFEKNPVVGIVVEKFDAKSLSGESVDNKIFGESKVTAINLWGTFCGPCIDEMPDLEKVSHKYETEDFNMVGIVVDGEEIETAKKIVNKLGVTYLNIIPDEKIMEQIVNKFDYVPATIFVNNEGKVLDSFIPGATDEESIIAIIDGLIENEK